VSLPRGRIQRCFITYAINRSVFSMLSLSADKSRAPARNESVLHVVARWLRWRLPKRISDYRILSGALRGKRIVTSWYDYPAAIAGITEPELLAWFGRKVKAGETWLDIGAHYGYTALSLGVLVGPAGRVFAFEPMAATAGCLARTRFINKIESLTVVPLALGAEEGMQLQKLATVRGMIDSTVRSDATNPSDSQWSEMILVAQMDWLWPRIAGSDLQIHGVKIDVQGMELHVLRGMAATLKTHRPKLVVELHHGVDRAEVLQLLTEIGYSTKATPIEPVEGEVDAGFHNDRSYAFEARAT
jgi:FkbM family methyltransferase